MYGRGSRKVEADIPLVEEFAPQYLSDVVGQVENVKKLRGMIEHGTMRNLLFHGETPGTGKTCTARCIGRELYGEDYDLCVYNFNASDKNSVEFIREELKEIVSSYNPTGHPFILIIIDEADGTSKQYQFALRRFIEDNIKRARFILICNKKGRILRPIQSRCRPMFFGPLQDDEIVFKLKEICEKKKIEYEDGVLQKIVELSDGSMREAESDLDILRLEHRRKLLKTDVDSADLTGNKIVEVYELAKEGKFIGAKNKVIETMKATGLSPEQIIEKMQGVCLRDKKESALTKARIIDQIGRTHYEIGESLSMMVQVQSLMARISLITKGNSTPKSDEE
jgi:replication factor C subunit 2/4